VFKDELNRPCAIGVLSRYMSLYGSAILYGTPRSFVEGLHLQQKISNILRSRFGSIVLRNCYAVI
jgi:hypothetical protein